MKPKRRIRTNQSGWTPLQPATIDRASLNRTIDDLRKKAKLSRSEAEEQAKRALGQEIWRNNIYQVNVTRYEPMAEGMPQLVHLSIRRRDRQVIKDWRDMQRIKNQLVGEECEGVELYPAESRLVDTANQFHLWCFDSEDFRFPFGFSERLVTDDVEIGDSKQRKL